MFYGCLDTTTEDEFLKNTKYYVNPVGIIDSPEALPETAKKLYEEAWDPISKVVGSCYVLDYNGETYIGLETFYDAENYPEGTTEKRTKILTDALCMVAFPVPFTVRRDVNTERGLEITVQVLIKAKYATREIKDKMLAILNNLDDIAAQDTGMDEIEKALAEAV